MLGHVLRPEELLTRAEYRYAAPAEALSPWVERYWSVEWRFAPGEEFHTSTLDDPATHLTVERGGVGRQGMDAPGVWFTGPGSTLRFDVRLTGSGSVVGARLRPGACFVFADAPFEIEADTTCPAARWFSDSEVLMRAPTNAVDAAPVLDEWLLGRAPEDTAELRQLREMLAALEEHPLEPLDATAARVGCSLRTMQRQFRRLVGVSPKRIRMRARVFRAAGHLDGGWEGSMAELASSLDWFDQAHFVRDFRAVTGTTPAAYAARR